MNLRKGNTIRDNLICILPTVHTFNLYFLLEEPQAIFSMQMIIGFDHAYWSTSPILTWPQISWVSTFLCLSWSLPQPCRKWLILKVQSKCSITVFYSISKEKFSWRNYLECRRACYGKSSSLCRNNNGLKDHNCDTSVITQTGQTLIRCADSLFFMFFQTLSSWSTSSVEEVNSVGPGIRFFQLYVWLFFISMYLQEALLVLCSSDWP